MKPVAEEITKTPNIYHNNLSSSFISAVDQFYFIHAEINTAKRTSPFPTH